MTGDLHDIISKESRKLHKHIQYTVESKMPVQCSFHGKSIKFKMQGHHMYSLLASLSMVLIYNLT